MYETYTLPAIAGPTAATNPQTTAIAAPNHLHIQESSAQRRHKLPSTESSAVVLAAKHPPKLAGVATSHNRVRNKLQAQLLPNRAFYYGVASIPNIPYNAIHHHSNGLHTYD